jgi:hypothetical protein
MWTGTRTGFWAEVAAFTEECSNLLEYRPGDLFPVHLNARTRRDSLRWRTATFYSTGACLYIAEGKCWLEQAHALGVITCIRGYHMH